MEGSVNKDRRGGRGIFREVIVPFAAGIILTECAVFVAGVVIDYASRSGDAAAAYFLRWPGDREIISLAAGMTALLLYSLKTAGPEIAHVESARGKLTRPGDLALLILISICAALAANGAAALLGSLPGPFSEMASGMTVPGSAAAGRTPGMHLLPGFMVYAFLSPLAEEALFRGVLFIRLGRRTAFAGAAFLSSALFSLWHGGGGIAAYALVMGMLFAWALAVTRKFAVTVAMHGAANAAVYLLYVASGLSGAASRPWMTALFALGAAMGIYLTRERVKKEDRD